MLFASTMEGTTPGMPRHAQTEEAWLKFVFGAISLLAFIITWQIVNGLWQRHYASSHPYVKENDLVTLSNHALTCLSPSVSLITADNVEQGRQNIADGCCLGLRLLLFQWERDQVHFKCLAHSHLSTFLATDVSEATWTFGTKLDIQNVHFSSKAKVRFHFSLCAVHKVLLKNK